MKLIENDEMVCRGCCEPKRVWQASFDRAHRSDKTKKKKPDNIPTDPAELPCPTCRLYSGAWLAKKNPIRSNNV